jgi:predicted small lipoprotein YifL
VRVVLDFAVAVRVSDGAAEAGVRDHREQLMTMKRSAQFSPAIALLLGAFISLAGCESKGPAEQAGEQVDKGIQNAKDAINPPGPVEKAGRAIDKATKTD